MCVIDPLCEIVFVTQIYYKDLTVIITVGFFRTLADSFVRFHVYHFPSLGIRMLAEHCNRHRCRHRPRGRASLDKKKGNVDRESAIRFIQKDRWATEGKNPDRDGSNLGAGIRTEACMTCLNRRYPSYFTVA